MGPTKKKREKKKKRRESHNLNISKKKETIIEGRKRRVKDEKERMK